jgi:hypothetical protein
MIPRDVCSASGRRTLAARVRTTPSVLLRGFNNPMIVELTKHLPFVMLWGARSSTTETGSASSSCSYSQFPGLDLLCRMCVASMGGKN